MKNKTADLLSIAGICINGSDPWDIVIRNDSFYSRVIAGGSLALGESYMDGWWDCDSIDEFIHKIFSAKLNFRVIDKKLYYFTYLKAKVLNLQRKSKAFYIGKHHYDIGNDLYSKMLGELMIYSCAYWKNARSLDEAQEAKLELICQKLGMRPGMSVLDIGCGWGGFALYASRKYGVHVTGVTVSENQVAAGRKLCSGLPVELIYRDYRELSGTFDRIVSVGMFEHVGYKNYRTFMKTVKQHLEPDGLFLLQTIGRNISSPQSDPWLNKYIFPNSKLPSAQEITKAAEGLLVMEDWHNFGDHYDRTLVAWYKNFKRNWESLKSRYDDRFYRMWSYYLLSSAGAFRARNNHLWQVVYSHDGMQGGYTGLR